MESFPGRFQALTGHTPFPWQADLFARLRDGRFPEVCAIPTGIGKTSAIAVWLLALAARAEADRLSGFPRRLVYIVNRRTVVDQATVDVEQWRRRVNEEPALAAVRHALRRLAVLFSDDVFAVSTLRGQRADNAEWRLDPARPAIVIGTVDMIGSRLLFGGYGCGFRSRPLHAGFLGQDVWLVHDEAHLEPAFQRLLVAIREEQRLSGDLRPFIVTALTATSRDSCVDFQLSDDDRLQDEVSRRLYARKALALRPVESRALADAVVERVLDHRESGQAILVYLRAVEDVDRVSERLASAGLAVAQLTGTLRGFERDRFVRDNPVFRRFAVDDSQVEPAAGTVCLVCTSAGEVGVNMSADHMVCDLTPFDSMAQRLGRVNRFGRGDARVDVLVAGLPDLPDGEPSDTSGDAYGLARARTARLLTLLPKSGQSTGGVVLYDASPAALESLPVEARRQAFSPSPVIMPASDFLFDAWALTSVRASLPGRPRPDAWLHGVAPWELPETTVAWRTEVDEVDEQLLQQCPPEELLDDYPLKPHETLRDRSHRVFAHLEKIAARAPDKRVWVVGTDGAIEVRTLKALVDTGRTAIEHRTLVLPPSAGGLSVDASGLPTGRLAGEVGRESAAPDAAYDVADLWLDEASQPRRRRIWNGEPAPEGMRLVRVLALEPPPDSTGDAEVRIWRWYVRPASADDQGSATALEPEPLDEHHQRAAAVAGTLASRLGLRRLEADAIRHAAGFHDLGKARSLWQRSIRNLRYPDVVLAKSGNTLVPHNLSSYRHELGSLMDVCRTAEFCALPPDVQDLVLHLIAAHHGRARPGFPASEAHDPERPAEEAAAVARDVMLRYGRLQRRYGRWGLAFLESLVRAADVLASNRNLAPPLDAQEAETTAPTATWTAPQECRRHRSVPSFHVDVDPLNPGEFLACCGLLEVADRLAPGAEGWFDDCGFTVRSGVPLPDIVRALIREPAEEVTALDDGVPVAPLIAPLIVKLAEEPRATLRLDAWMALRVERGKVVAGPNRPWNFWSGQQTSLRIWRALRQALQQQVANGGDLLGTGLFSRRVPLPGRFGFDPGAAWTALDVGFSPNEQNIPVASSPAVELLAAVGLQRFRPLVSEDRETFRYSTWTAPLAPCVAAAACAGLLASGGRSFRGFVVSRGSYAALGTSIPL